MVGGRGASCARLRCGGRLVDKDQVGLVGGWLGRARARVSHSAGHSLLLKQLQRRTPRAAARTIASCAQDFLKKIGGEVSKNVGSCLFF